MYHPYQVVDQQQPSNHVINQDINTPSSSSFHHQREQSSSTEDSSLANYLNDEKSKRKQSLEKNRLAAYRCRERKKNEQQQMVEQAEFLSVQNESLQLIVGNLRNEIIGLRELLLAHDTCDCERVQLFIQRSSSLM